MPPDVTVSGWAQRYRMIASQSSESGPWRNDRAPYLTAIMDAYGDPAVEVIDIMGPAQCGKTEAVFNMLAHTVDIDPVPAMYVNARDESSQDIFDDRLVPMFEASPSLARHMTDSPRDVKTGRVIKFDRMNLYFATARSASALASKPIGRVFLDEVDKYPQFVSAEGNPVKLAERRTTTFGDVKIVNLCTPTTKDGFIYRSYCQSNMQRYWLRCPYCGKWFDPKFTQLKIDPPDLRDPDIIIEGGHVYYLCEHCEKRIEEYHKQEMIAGGKWVAAGQYIEEGAVNHVGFTVAGVPKRSKRHSGYWISGLINPWLSWSRLMAQWFVASDEEQSIAGELREFINQALGDPWEEKGVRADEKKMHAHIGDYTQGTVPDGCLMLVASADFHETKSGYDTIDFEVRGFGKGMRRWVISAGAVATWSELENELFFAPFPWSNPEPRGVQGGEGGNKDRPELAVVVTFIDSGYKPDKVYDFCAKYPGFCYPIKGASQPQRAPIVAGKLDRTALARTGRHYAGLQLFILDTGFFKDKVAGTLEKEKGLAGSVEFYDGIHERYFKELANEHKIQTVDKYGRRHWHWEVVSSGAAAHSLDLAVYAEAAGMFKKANVYFGRDEGEIVRTPAGALRPAVVRRVGKVER